MHGRQMGAAGVTRPIRLTGRSVKCTLKAMRVMTQAVSERGDSSGQAKVGLQTLVFVPHLSGEGC